MLVHKLSLFLIAASAAVGLPAMAMAAPQRLAATPPMGWNGWAHYQCGFTAADILANARALVRTGLAAHGYDTVTIDDCWMLKDRDSEGNLQADPRRFPRGMRPVADAIRAMGLRFGIYEDAGPATCGGFAGSGGSVAGGKPHFLADARLFAGWGVDYLKLDGCNVQPARGPAGNAAYRAVDALDAEIDAHDTALWKIRPAGGCRAAERVGVVTRIVPEVPQMPEGVQRYTRCLAAPGRVQECAGTAAQRWRFTRHGSLRSGEECLTQSGKRAVLAKCRSADGQRWRYTLLGNLINRASRLCLTGAGDGTLAVRACGHNLASQIWSIPNGIGGGLTPTGRGAGGS